MVVEDVDFPQGVSVIDDAGAGERDVSPNHLDAPLANWRVSQHVCEACGQTIPSTKDIPGPSKRK